MPKTMRAFPNSLPEGAPVLRVDLENGFTTHLAAVLSYATSSPALYTGLSGVAFALWHARRSLLSRCRHHPIPPPPPPALACPPASPSSATAAATANDLPTALLAAALQRCRTALAALPNRGLSSGARAASFLDGGAGVHVTAALVLHDAALAAEAAAEAGEAKALRRERDDRVLSFLEAYPDAMDSDNDEYLYGRAGYLQGCSLLNAVLGPGTVADEVLEGLVTEIIASGRELAGRVRYRRTDTPAPPLFYMWPSREAGEPYLGAAHGLMGIVFALLHSPHALEHHADDLRGSLRFIAAHEMDAAGCSARGGHYPTRMRVAEPDASEASPSSKVLVHWCHGSPGAVLLWCKAHEVFGDPGYLAAAERAGEVVWQLGLLRKGHGLCHGTSGNAYALLALHRATGGQPPRWLQRARQFAAHILSPLGRTVHDQPDRPLSLFEGRGGVVCLLADLLADDEGAAGARFPAFELPPPPAEATAAAAQ